MQPRASAVAAVAIALLGAGAARLRVPTDVPLGPDAPLWGLAAMGLTDGRGPPVPPGYPAIVAAVAAVTGQPAWACGGWVSTVAFAATLAGVAAIARRLGVPPAIALAAAAATALTPDLAAFAVQLQPDALTAALWTGWLAAALRFGPPGALVAALPMLAVREHGAPLVAISAAAWAIGRSGRGGVAGVGIVAAVGVTLVAARPDLLPARLARPLLDSALGAGGPLPHFVGELGGPRADAFARAWRAGDGVAVWTATVGETARRGGPTALAVLVGAGSAAAVLRARAWPWAAAIGVWAPFLLVWSQRRHFAVAWPLAWIGVAVGLGAVAARRRWVGPTAWIGVAVVAALGLRPGAGKPPAERPAIDRQRLAADLAALPGTWLLGGHDHDVNLYLGWTRNTVPADVAGGTPDGAAWRTVWVDAPGALAPPWVEVARRGQFAAFVLAPPPSDASRPCADTRVVPGPLYADGLVAGTVTPPCRAMLR